MRFRTFTGLFIIAILTIGCAIKTVKPGLVDEWQGQVLVGVMRIGAETTGIVLKTNNGSFELEISDPTLLEEVKKNDGSMATVKGLLRELSGVEVPSRRIIKVETITFN